MRNIGHRCGPRPVAEAIASAVAVLPRGRVEHCEHVRVGEVDLDRADPAVELPEQAAPLAVGQQPL